MEDTFLYPPTRPLASLPSHTACFMSKNLFVDLYEKMRAQVWANGDVKISTGEQGKTPAGKVILNLMLAIFKVEVRGVFFFMPFRMTGRHACLFCMAMS